MNTICRLKPEQVGAVKRVICTVVHEIFAGTATTTQAVNELVVKYDKAGILRDIDEAPTKYFGDRGEFLVLLDATGRVVGSGAILKLDERTCELKRLWFLPEFRGRGLGRRMAEQLLDFARRAGYSKVRLDTSSKCVAAQRLFRALGFQDIERYNDSRNDCFMEMML